MPKITDAHIRPNNFQKMSVRLAVQILSRSVSAAISTAYESGQLISKTALNTANFIKVINNCFDALNSRRLNDSNLCSVALSENSNHAFKALDTAFDILKNLNKIRSGKTTRPPCFDGLLLTINGIKQIYEVQKEKGYDFLLTRRLNQDILENQFLIYRQRGGYNRNPTVRTFQAAFKSNSIMNLLRPPRTSSYEPDNVFENLLDCYDAQHQNLEDVASSSSSDTSETESSLSFHSDNSDMKMSLESCAVAYFAGYVGKKTIDHFNCDTCLHNLIGEDDIPKNNEVLIFYKEYNLNEPSSLKRPSSLCYNVVKNTMKLFYQHVKKELCTNENVYSDY